VLNQVRTASDQAPCLTSPIKPRSDCPDTGAAGCSSKSHPVRVTSRGIRPQSPECASLAYRPAPDCPVCSKIIRLCHGTRRWLGAALVRPARPAISSLPDTAKEQPLFDEQWLTCRGRRRSEPAGAGLQMWQRARAVRGGVHARDVQDGKLRRHPRRVSVSRPGLLRMRKHARRGRLSHRPSSGDPVGLIYGAGEPFR
jgi:hypothetical protein